MVTQFTRAAHLARFYSSQAANWRRCRDNAGWPVTPAHPSPMTGVFANHDSRRSNWSAGAVDVADGEPRGDPGNTGESIRSAFQAMRSAMDSEAPRPLRSSPAIGNYHQTGGP